MNRASKEFQAEIADARQNVNSALMMLNKMYLEYSFEKANMPIIDFSDLVLVPVLDNIGDRWQKGDLSLAQIYMASRMVEKLVEDNISESETELKDCGLAVVVFEDFHVLGKRLLSSVVKAAGYKFKDLGRLDCDEVIEKIKDDDTRILLISTLLLPSALKVKELKTRLREINRDVALIVGGAPFRFDTDLWREVGADAFSATASGVVPILNQMTAGV